MCNIDDVKAKLNSGKIYDIFPCGDTVSWIPFGVNGVHVSFDSHVRNFDRVRVGTAFKMIGGAKPINYKLTVEKVNGMFQFNWRGNVKPENWLKIEQKLS